ncbi:MAG: acyl carrier protein, partial [Mycobacterium sp.]|uniref:acyl carrier protein n=1 Tax=Mycobacterium sp. TaxID=1785 RepID=UPI003CC6169E
DVALEDLGLDSLRGLEYPHIIPAVIGQTFSQTKLFENPTLSKLVEYLTGDSTKSGPLHHPTGGARTDRPFQSTVADFDKPSDLTPFKFELKIDGLVPFNSQILQA